MRCEPGAVMNDLSWVRRAVLRATGRSYSAFGLLTVWTLIAEGDDCRCRPRREIRFLPIARQRGCPGDGLCHAGGVPRRGGECGLKITRAAVARFGRGWRRTRRSPRRPRQGRGGAGDGRRRR